MICESFSRTVKLVVMLSSIMLTSTITNVAKASDIKVLCAVALRPVLADLVSEFERTSGNKVIVEYGLIGPLADRIQKGETADVAIVSARQIDDLQEHGKVIPSSRVDIAKVGVGIITRKGAPKPDISSADALKRSLLAATSIGYSGPANGGPTGAYMAELISRFGINEDMKSKTKLFPNAPPLYKSVSTGEVEIGFSLMSEISGEPSVELVGPLPPSIQNYTFFAAGVVTDSKVRDAAKSLIFYISSPAAQKSLTSKGFETR